MISLLVSDFRKISVSVPSIPVAVLGLYYKILLSAYNQLLERLFLFTSEVAKIFCRFSLTPALPPVEDLQSVER